MAKFFDVSKLKDLMQNPLVKLFLRAIQLLAVLAVLYYMLDKLGEIGWDDVWQSLPTTPWFYIMFLAMYFALPIGEWLVYQEIWGKAVKDRFDVFLRARIYNLAIVSYAGEAFIALWAHQNLAKKGRVAVSAVKDSNILSALASNSFTVMLLAAFFLTGQLEVLTDADPDYGYYIGLSVAVGLFLVPIVLRYHARILGLPPEKAKRVFFIHLCRLVAILLLQAGQWAVVFPDVPFDTWILLLTAQMVLTRVPFLPNTDLLFAGLGITLMHYVDGPAAAVAGMFLAAGALNQILNLVFFIITSFTQKRAIPLETQSA
ncbi:hypothetical protein [Kordiimonas laminariae]|uniref:hypothetical protein n=1 Tax=Kordiimonas laminariae TaxID=2917717 RepID=UPI001FF3520C|nr:hypothetical protein [Kordiimonas laminariae]MCK0070804.1 hypothetical protein [Kordiimonas laminariae]